MTLACPKKVLPVIVSPQAISVAVLQSRAAPKVKSANINTPLAHEQYFVIDGQQRLQTFYIGLTGSYNGKDLYFNLNSDYKKLDFDFVYIDSFLSPHSDCASRILPTVNKNAINNIILHFLEIN